MHIAVCTVAAYDLPTNYATLIRIGLFLFSAIVALSQFCALALDMQTR